MQTQPTIDLEMMTPQEVQGVLKCSLAYVYKLVDRGHLPAWKGPSMGNGIEKSRAMVRLKRSDVVKFIEDYYKST